MVSKRVFMFALVILFVSTGLLVACAQPAPPPERKPIELVYANWTPAAHVSTGVLADEWAEKVYAATDGRVRIRTVHGGTMFKGPDQLDGVINRVADAAVIAPAFHPGQLPISNLMTGMMDPDIGSKLNLRRVLTITETLHAEFPEFREEGRKLGVTPLVYLPTFAYWVISTKPINTLKDFRGLKIRTLGTLIPKLFEVVEAVPVSLSPGEAYLALQTGVIDGYVADPMAFESFKWYEVARYVNTLSPEWGIFTGLANLQYIINNESLARLTEQDQKILKRVSGEMAGYGVDVLTRAEMEAMDYMKRQGVTITHMPQTEVDKWIAKSPDWYGLIASDLNARGLPGTKFISRWKGIVKEVVLR